MDNTVRLLKLSRCNVRDEFRNADADGASRHARRIFTVQTACCLSERSLLIVTAISVHLLPVE